MVSFGLAFGKGAVTALRQKQERKWEKEAYEESPEFELAGLQIKQAKENLEKTGWDIKKLRREVEGAGDKNFDVFPLGGNYTSRVPKDFSGTMDTSPYAFQNINNLINADDNYKQAIMLTDSYGNPKGEIAQTTASYFTTNLHRFAKDKTGKDGIISLPLDKLPPLFANKDFLSLPWVGKAIISSITTPTEYADYVDSLKSEVKPSLQINTSSDGKNIEITKTTTHDSGKPDKKDQDFYDKYPLWKTGRGKQILASHDNQMTYANYVLEDEKEGYNKVGFRAKHVHPDFSDYQIIDNILVDHPPAPSEYTEVIGGRKIFKERSLSGDENKRAEFTAAHEASDEIIKKTDAYLNVLKDPSVIPGAVGFAEGFVTSLIGRGGIVPNVGTVLTKYAGLQREITETDQDYKWHREAQRLIKNVQEGASKGVLSKRATMDAIRIDLAYTIALANNGGDAKSLSDKDFAYALKQVGDFNAPLATKSEINEKLVRLAVKEEERKYMYYMKASENFGGKGTHSLYAGFANKVGRERGNLLRAHYYATGHEGVLKPNTYTIDQVEKYDPRRDMPSTNSILFNQQRDL